MSFETLVRTEKANMCLPLSSDYTKGRKREDRGIRTYPAWDRVVTDIASVASRCHA